MTDDTAPIGAQAEALRLAHALDGGKLIDDSTEWADTLHAAAAMLRNLRIEATEQARLLGISAEREMALRARVQELERELSSIGAGGVEPLQRGVHWVPVAERLPEPGTPVLLDIGKRFPIRAMWAAKHTVEASDEMAGEDWCEYDEATDTYYCPPGWYEWNEHEECHWSVSATPRAWMALPEQDRARGAQGESNAPAG